MRGAVDAANDATVVCVFACLEPRGSEGAAEGVSLAALLAAAGAVVALVAGAPFFALGALGGGDVKLLVVTGAFLGPSRLLVAFLVIGILGGLLALLFALAQGRLQSVLFSTWSLTLNLATLGRRGAPRTVASTGALTIPYGVAIAVGSLLTWYVYAPVLGGG